MQSVVDAYCHFGSVYGSLQIAVYITALVGFRQEIVEVEHRNRVVLDTEIRICVEVTADIVNLTVGDEQFGYASLIAVWQSLIESHAPYDLGELRFCQASLRKRLQQMNVLCRTERIEQVKHLLVEVVERHHFKLNLCALSCQHLIGADIHSPAYKDRELLCATVGTVEIQVVVVALSWQWLY